jgi:type II secretory pathway pseudopilin PulG
VSSLLIAILTLALVGAAIAIISGPLRAERARAGASEEAQAGRAELEAAREAKYREIRDAELDYRTGKLSDADYAVVDAQLRAEAVTILDRLERLEAQAGTAGAGRDPAG